MTQKPTGHTCQWCLMREGWGSAYILVVLHLSMAFHIIGHGIILGWLWELELGGTVLHCLLHGHFQSVLIGSKKSSPQTLRGMLWSLYSLHSFLTSIQGQLGEIICQHGMWYKLYADDTQLYISISGDMSDAVTALLQSLEVVVIWMGDNRLHLNAGKIKWQWVCETSGVSGFGIQEFIIFSSEWCCSILDRPGTQCSPRLTTPFQRATKLN